MTADIMRQILDGRNEPPVYLFKSREDAAQKLVIFQQSYGLPFDVLVFIPMGGVPLKDAFLSSYSILDVHVFPVVKIPSTVDKRFGIGALDIWGNASLNKLVIDAFGESEVNIEANIGKALEKHRAIIQRFGFDVPTSQTFSDKNVLIVDDGLSSGLTVEAALNSIYKISVPKSVNCLIPIVYSAGIRRIRSKFANVNIHSLYVDNEPVFLVDDFYQDFSEVR